MDFTKLVAPQSRPFASKNKYPPRITGNPPGIVKRKAGRDNSVGVERGFCARGEMAYWLSAHVSSARIYAAQAAAKEKNWTSFRTRSIRIFPSDRFFLIEEFVRDNPDKLVFLYQ